MRHPHQLWAVAAAALVFAACSDPTTPTSDPFLSLNVTNGPHDPVDGILTVCKTGGPADFTLEWLDVLEEFSLQDGECMDVHSWPDGMDTEVTVTEVPNAAFPLIKIVKEDAGGSQDITGTNSVTGVLAGVVLTFVNGQEPAVGRMTGGGFQIRVDGVRVSRGLTLHCDNTLSNNLEINWAGGNQWHIEKESLTNIECIDDPNFDPTPPPAPFDTFIAEAIGRLNGVDGSVIRFKFIDDGEPGRTDEAHFDIWAPGANPDTDEPVLSVSGQLDGGNLQAHFDQPHS